MKILFDMFYVFSLWEDTQSLDSMTDGRTDIGTDRGDAISPSLFKKSVGIKSIFIYSVGQL